LAKKTKDRDSYNFKKIPNPKCKACPVKHLCTSRASGREIDQPHIDAVEEKQQAVS
jgi:adenine-specific DNA glycosylase